MTIGPVGGGGQVPDVGGPDWQDSGARDGVAEDAGGGAAPPGRSAAAMAGDSMHGSMLASQLAVGAGGAGAAPLTDHTAPPTTLTQEQWDQRAQRAAAAAIPGGEAWKGQFREMVQQAVSQEHDRFADGSNVGVELPRRDLEQMASRLNQQFSHGPNALPVRAAVEGDPPNIVFHNQQSRDQTMDFGH